MHRYFFEGRSKAFFGSTETMNDKEVIMTGKRKSYRALEIFDLELNSIL